MNSHDPFNTGGGGCPNDTRSADQIVNHIIGNAYWVVRRVYDSIKHVDTVAINIDKVKTLAEAMDVLNALYADLDALNAIYTDLGDLNAIADALNELNEIGVNLKEIMYVYDLVKTKGFIITVDSTEAMTALDSERINYARVYSETSSGYSYVDYAFMEGNLTGIPAHDSTTGTWIAIGSSTNALTLNSIAKLYHSTVGQTTLVLDEEALGVSAVYIEGIRQQPDQGFVYNGATRTVTFAEAIDDAGLEIVVIASGVYIEGQNTLVDALKGNTGATLVGTSSGDTVQEVLTSLDENKLDTNSLNSNIVPHQANVSAIARTVFAALNDFINLHDYYNSADGTDWLPAWTRALAVSPKVLVPFGSHPVSNYVDVPSSARFIGLGKASIVKSYDAIDAAGSALTPVFRAEGKDDIIIEGLTVDGGVTEINTVKKFARTIRFINCTNVTLNNIQVLNNSDWATSFEGGSNITVTNYTQKSYVYTNTANALYGGRDGLHFMDVSNVYAHNLDIDSGDDCVGITTTGVDMDNIHISQVRGSSSIASIVIFNEEQDSGGVYYSNKLTNLTIDNVSVKSGGKARNIVRVIKYGTDTVIKNVRVTNVQGTAYNSYGLWLAYISEVYTAGIDVKSQQAHGIQLSNLTRLSGSAKGAYLGDNTLATYVGVNISSVTHSTYSPGSFDSYSYGVQILTCTDSTFIPDIHNCGSGLFSTSTGGNLRVVNNTRISIPSGRAVGDSTVSYWGIMQSGNTDLNIGLEFVYSGYTNSVLPSSYYLKTPIVDVKLTESSAGAITTNLLIGATVVRNSVGNYTITFSSAMRSTRYSWFACAYINGAARLVRLASGVGTTSITLSVVDITGTASYADHFEFKAYNAGS